MSDWKIAVDGFAGLANLGMFLWVWTTLLNSIQADSFLWFIFQAWFVVSVISAVSTIVSKRALITDEVKKVAAKFGLRT